MPQPMVLFSALVATGFAAWPLLEDVIHGVLSHRLRTAAAAMHWTHHRDDNARVADRVPLTGNNNLGRLLPRRVDLPARRPELHSKP